MDIVESQGRLLRELMLTCAGLRRRSDVAIEQAEAALNAAEERRAARLAGSTRPGEEAAAELAAAQDGSGP